MRLGKIATLAAVAVLATACGKSGGAGSPTPTPTPGPTPTPTPVVPHIADVRPHGAGSAGTTWVINGTGFDATPANDVVTFESSTATVSSATATKLIVHSAFAPVSSTQTLHVTVTVGGLASNVFVVTAMPGGSAVTLQVSLWSSADEVTSNAGALYVLDRGKNAIFAYDYASMVVRPLVNDTAGTITHEFVGPGGALWFGDVIGGAERLYTADLATGVSTPIVSLGNGEQLQGGTFDGTDLFITTQTGGNDVMLRKITAGAFDATFGPVDLGSTDVPGVWAEGGDVAASDRQNAQIVFVDEANPDNGAMAIIGLNGPGRMVGDGVANFFVVDNDQGPEISEFTICCGSMPFANPAITDYMQTNTIALDQATGLAIDANANLFLAAGQPLAMPAVGNVFPGTQLAQLPAIPDPRVIKFDANANYSLGVAGFGRIGSVESVGGVDYFTDFGGCVTLADGTLAGPLFSYDALGVPRFVGSGPCFGTLRADGTGLVFADADTDVLDRVSLTDGSLTTIVDGNSGLTTVRSVVRDPNDGSFYVIGRDTGDAIAGVQKISNDGNTVTNDFVTDGNAQLFTAAAIVGTDLWLTELDNGGAFSIVTVPLATGGTPAPLVASGVDVQLDGMEPDGAGGAWIADSESGSVSHVANATVTPFSTGSDPTVGLAIDDYADVVATDVDGTTGVRAILP